MKYSNRRGNVRSDIFRRQMLKDLALALINRDALIRLYFKISARLFERRGAWHHRCELVRVKGFQRSPLGHEGSKGEVARPLSWRENR